MPKTSLDAIDRKILKYLIKNARIVELADALMDRGA